jgi:enoyl-CoA hydratase/carnithine racemase
MSVIETSLNDGMYEVTLNRPEVENAINTEMLDALAAVLDEVEQREDIHGVLLRGAGDSFCVGMDPRDAGTRAFYPSPSDRPYMSDIFINQWSRWRVWRRFSETPKPVVVAIHGRALGEGALMAMAADLSIAAEDAVFGDPAIRMGMASANPLWLWSVGPRRSREILFGRYIDAQTAARWGLITRVVPRSDLHQEALIALEARIKRGGMAGVDGQIAGSYIRHSGSDAAGVTTAKDFAQAIAALSANQRYGFRPGEYNFWARVQELGIEDALKERDERYAAFAPAGG